MRVFGSWPARGAAVGVLGAALAFAGFLPAQAAPAGPAGFSLTWSDDFDGAAGTGLDTGTWHYETGPGAGFGTGEIETMTDSTANVFHDGNGHLVLKALRDGGGAWTSGRVATQASTFGAEAGGVVRMESSLQLPAVSTGNGAGYWPAFWMLGAPFRQGVAWPGSGEIDIMETINGHPSTFGTLHCGTAPGGPCNENQGVSSGEKPGASGGFHTYAVEIDRSTTPEQIRWYFDGAQYFSVSASQFDATTWANAVDHPFYIIYDLAIGGGFPDAFGGGPTDATVSGGELAVDWVAVYNKGGGGGGGAAPAPAPTGTTTAQPAPAQPAPAQPAPAQPAPAQPAPAQPAPAQPAPTTTQPQGPGAWTGQRGGWWRR